MAIDPVPEEQEVEDEAVIEEQLTEAGLIRPPDGGYGWVVVLASFIANVMVDGIIYAIQGNLIPLWIEEFQVSQFRASLATALLVGVLLLSGPIASALANMFGCRLVTIAGSVIAFAGFMISAFIPQLNILYFTFGVIGGLGFGLIYLPAIVIVGQYFSEKRAMATGLAVCGSGIGVTIFSKLFPWILGIFENDWRKFLIVVAFMSLSCGLCGLAFRPLQPTPKQVEQVAEIVTSYHERCDEAARKYSTAAETETTTSPHVAHGIEIERFGSVAALRRRGSDRPFLSTLDMHARQHQERNVWSQRDIAKLVSETSVNEMNRPLSRQDIFYSGSTAQLAKTTQHSNGAEKPIAATAVGSIYLSTVGLPTEDEIANKGTKAWTTGVMSTLKAMIDPSLLRRPSFAILAVSGFMSMSCFFVPFTQLQPQAEKQGLTKEQATTLITILGVANIVSRVVSGLIADRPQVDPLLVSNIAIITAGIGTICVPFLGSFVTLTIYCVMFAFGVGCFAALRSVICVELLGLARLTSAFGILLLFMGFAALLGTPVAGFLRDLTGNFDLSFYVMGTIMTLSGLICLPLRYISTLEQRRKPGHAERDGAEEEVKPLRSNGNHA